jgi:hypothetical protein
MGGEWFLLHSIQKTNLLENKDGKKERKEQKLTASNHGPVATPIHFNPSNSLLNLSTNPLASLFGQNSGTASTIPPFNPSPAYSVGRIHLTPALAAASIIWLCTPIAMKLRAKIAASCPWKAVERKAGSE